MSLGIEACAECTKKCLQHHGKKRTSSPFIAKFFKVMIGDQFLKVLHIPPRFAPIVSALVGKGTSLEDSNGEKWEAKIIPKINGSFAFQQGWQSFALGHGLELGDFLVFHYIPGSHFVVDIYDKSGCQKLDFPVNRSKKKKARNSRNYDHQDATHHKVDKDSHSKHSPLIPTLSGSDMEISQSQFEANIAEVNKAAENNLNCETSKRPHPVSKDHDMEDTNFIINRDIGDQQGEGRHILSDLPRFEKQGNIPGIDESNKAVAGHVRYHADTFEGLHIKDGLGRKDSGIEEVGTGAVALAASKFEMTVKNDDTSLIDKLAAGSDKGSCNKIAGYPFTATSAKKPLIDEENCTDMSNLIQRNENSLSMPEINELVLSWKRCNFVGHNNPSAQVKLTGMSKSEGPVITCLSQCQSGKTTETINRESMEMTRVVHDAEETTRAMEVKHVLTSSMIIEDNDEIHGVESENVDLVSSSIHNSTDMSVFVSSENETFIELPSCLPSLFSSKERMGINRKVVFLKDPVMRVWPVLYLERYGVNLLTSGWKAFCKASKIGAGDTCVFGIENESKSTYTIRVIRKLDAV